MPVKIVSENCFVGNNVILYFAELLLQTFSYLVMKMCAQP